MWYRKDGFPDDGDVVLCTVKQILHNSIFVVLDEYKNAEGIVHISEIAPGRIRTIREYVREGKKIICVVLRTNKERGHIELSLRRVTRSMNTKKSEDLKLENKCEKVFEIIAHKEKKNVELLYREVGVKIIERYGSLYAGFKEAYEQGEKAFEDVIVDKRMIDDLLEIIRVRLKPAEVTIARVVTLRNKGPRGIEVIKGLLIGAVELAKKEKELVEFRYTGAPRYQMVVRSVEYKKAQVVVDKLTEWLCAEAQKTGCECAVEK